jgi:hypothetical protein
MQKNSMKYRTLYLVTAAMLSATPALWAQQQISGVTPGNVSVERSGKYLSVDMDVDVADLDVKGDRAVILTPWLTRGADSLALNSIGIYGRQRYYYYMRNDGTAITGEAEQSYRSSECPDHIAYHDVVDYADWMNGADLTLRRSDYGCCNKVLAAEGSDAIGHYKDHVFSPQPLFVKPEAVAEKQLEESGKAMVIFPVNQTYLVPTLANNDAELGRIRADVSRIRDDKDVSGTQITLKGFASPEGTYENNKRLAEGRTEAVRSYLQNYYHMPAGTVTAESEPENWQGLRTYVEQTALEHRNEILAIIDNTDLEPDAREWRLKQTYPAEYATLLNTCYPSLRCTEYHILYSVRCYTDIEEIKQIYKTNPKKLSLNELYLLAQTYEVGSDDFTDVFETAVRLYPDDPTANLNAASLALQRGELKRSADYLDKAGSSPQATYVRGVLAARNADYTTAATLLRQVAAAGVSEAQDALTQLADCRLIAAQ